MLPADLIAETLAQLDACRAALRDLSLARALRHLNRARAILRAARACSRIDDQDRADPRNPATPPTA